MSQDSPSAPSGSPQPSREIAQGLAMFSPADEQALATERAELAALEGKPFYRRWLGFTRITGPGWLQSAMTLGGGSAVSSLYLGAMFGYELLWVQPLAMLLGVVMLSAMSYQTLSTGTRPFAAMNRYVHPALGWAWALATLVSTLIWHFPQYGLAAGMTADMIHAGTGWAPTGAGLTLLLLGIGAVVLAISIAIVWNYGSGHAGIRLYERLLKAMVWLIIVAFLVVVVRGTLAGKVEWGKIAAGLVPTHIPTSTEGVSVLMAAFGAAVGINMTFLFPYTLLARRWGREHRSLSRFDLVTGMLIPFTIATGLIVVAAASTIQGEVGGRISPIQAARMFEADLGKVFSRYVFGLGVLGMALSSITTHMLVSGFAFCEIFGIEPRGWRYKLACLLPAPGLLGVVLWPYMATWIAIPTSAICGLLLPIAYVGFFVLNNRKAYLGADTPRGGRALRWNLAMILAIAAALSSSIYYLYTRVPGFLGGLFGAE